MQNRCMDIDVKDRALLNLVQSDCRTGVEALAEEVGLSPAAVHRRLKRLRDTGVISKEVAVVDPTRVGKPMTFIVSVELERERTDQLDAFRRKAKADPSVQQCYYVTGEGDFILIITAADMDDFEAITRRIFFDDPNIRRFKTSVVMQRTQVSLAVDAN